MHIILAALGAIITILILTKRLGESGFSLSSLNPFAWYRRHKWQQRYHAKPLYNLTGSLESAALMMVATAKCDGDMSSQQKQLLLQLFEDKLKLSPKDAEEYLISSVFLLKDELDVIGQIPKILAPSKANFTPDQTDSLIGMMTGIAHVDSSARNTHKELIAAVKSALQTGVSKGSW